MKSRGLVVAFAVLLAVAAAAAVLLYTNGVKKSAETGGNLQAVIVATQDIPANTSLDAVIESGGFKTLNVPADAVVTGAVTSLDQLKGQTTTAPIVANEQLASSNLSSGNQVQGGALGISPGHIAVTVQVSAPDGVNGNVQRGNNVSVFATFTGASVIKGTLQQILSPTGTTATDRQDLPDFTITLIPTVRVLDVQNPVVASDGTKSGSTVTLTLDLAKQDAQNLVYAMASAKLTFGLLPPGEKGAQPPASMVPIQLLFGKHP